MSWWRPKLLQPGFVMKNKTTNWHTVKERCSAHGKHKHACKRIFDVGIFRTMCTQELTGGHRRWGSKPGNPSKTAPPIPLQHKQRENIRTRRHSGRGWPDTLPLPDQEEQLTRSRWKSSGQGRQSERDEEGDVWGCKNLQIPSLMAFNFICWPFGRFFMFFMTGCISECQKQTWNNKKNKLPSSTRMLLKLT